MDEDDTVLLRVAADSAEFRQSLGEMRAALTDELVPAADVAGRGIESALQHAARNGSLAFRDLARVAARALGEMAASALAPGSSALGSALGSATAGILGLAGRATGGPVAPGQAYLVGERGPEVFVPTSSGRIENGSAATRPVNLTVNISGGAGQSREFMAETARQMARSVRRAMAQAEA